MTVPISRAGQVWLAEVSGYEAFLVLSSRERAPAPPDYRGVVHAVLALGSDERWTWFEDPADPWQEQEGFTRLF